MPFVEVRDGLIARLGGEPSIKVLMQRGTYPGSVTFKIAGECKNHLPFSAKKTGSQKRRKTHV